MASPAVQTASENSGNSATPTITEPASTAQGDLLLAVVGSATPGTAITGLTGWTQLAEGDDGQGNRFWYGWIIRGASAPDLVAAAANTNWVTGCLRITGHDATTPIGSDHANSTTGTNPGVNPDPPNVDPGSSRDHLAVAAAVQEGKDDNRFAGGAPSGYTLRSDVGTAGGGAGTTHVGLGIASLGYTGQAQNPGTFTSGRSDGWVGITVIVRPAAGQTISVGTLAQTDSLVAAGRAKTKGVGVLAQTDSLVPAARTKTYPVGTLAQADSLNAVPHVRGYPVGTFAESDLLVAIGRAKAQAVGVLAESDSLVAIAVVMGGGQDIAVTTLAQTDSLIDGGHPGGY
jgi:hypothetical protein